VARTAAIQSKSNPVTAAPESVAGLPSMHEMDRIRYIVRTGLS
jgi:hypothetical protein